MVSIVAEDTDKCSVAGLQPIIIRSYLLLINTYFCYPRSQTPATQTRWHSWFYLVLNPVSIYYLKSIHYLPPHSHSTYNMHSNYRRLPPKEFQSQYLVKKHSYCLSASSISPYHNTCISHPIVPIRQYLFIPKKQHSWEILLVGKNRYVITDQEWHGVYKY